MAALMASNGRLNPRDLAPISGGGKLQTDAARAWNAFARCVWSEHGQRVQVTDSYRPLGKPGDLRRGVWSQWAAWERYQQGGNLAARPGTSNHGWGLAVDLPPATVELVRKYGAPFGWDHRHTDAPSESWHHLWRAGETNQQLVRKWSAVGVGDTIRPGDVGGGVTYAKQRLKLWGAWPRTWKIDNRYAGRTHLAVKAFQKAHRLPADGVIGPNTWKALNSRPSHPVRKPVVKPKPAVQPPRPKPAAPVNTPKPTDRTYFADVYEGDKFDAVAYRDGGSRLIILKATEGRTWQDGTYKARVAACRKAKLTVFSYHCARPGNGNTPESEAANFATAIKAAGAHLDPAHRCVLDWEDPNFKANGNEWVRRFIKAFAAHGLTLRVLYSGSWYLKSTLTEWPRDEHGRELRYWHASYSTLPEHNVLKLAEKHLWAVQFTDNNQGNPSHRLPGVSAGDVSYLK